MSRYSKKGLHICNFMRDKGNPVAGFFGGGVFVVKSVLGQVLRMMETEWTAIPIMKSAIRKSALKAFSIAGRGYFAYFPALPQSAGCLSNSYQRDLSVICVLALRDGRGLAADNGFANGEDGRQGIIIEISGMAKICNGFYKAVLPWEQFSVKPVPADFQRTRFALWQIIGFHCKGSVFDSIGQVMPFSVFALLQRKIRAKLQSRVCIVKKAEGCAVWCNAARQDGK